MSAVVPKSRLWGEDLGKGNLLGKSQGKIKRVRDVKTEIRRGGWSPGLVLGDSKVPQWFLLDNAGHTSALSPPGQGCRSGTPPHPTDQSSVRGFPGAAWFPTPCALTALGKAGPAPQGHPHDSHGCVGVPASGRGTDGEGWWCPFQHAEGSSGILSPPKLCLQPWALSRSTLVPQYYMDRGLPCHSGPFFSQEGPSVWKESGPTMAVGLSVSSG